MKHTKLWIIVVFAAVITGSILIASAMETFKVPAEPSEVENCLHCSQPPQNYLQPPENAKVIPELGSIQFDLSLDTREIVLSKGQSMDLAVTIYSPQKVDLLVTVGAEDHVPDLALIGLQPELPSGITASLDRTEISVEAGPAVTMNLILSIGDRATPGTYTLHIFAIRKTSCGGTAVGVPFQLTIL